MRGGKAASLKSLEVTLSREMNGFLFDLPRVCDIYDRSQWPHGQNFFFIVAYLSGFIVFSPSSASPHGALLLSSPLSTILRLPPGAILLNLPPFHYPPLPPRSITLNDNVPPSHHPPPSPAEHYSYLPPFPPHPYLPIPLSFLNILYHIYLRPSKNFRGE